MGTRDSAVDDLLPQKCNLKRTPVDVYDSLRLR